MCEILTNQNISVSGFFPEVIHAGVHPSLPPLLITCSLPDTGLVTGDTKTTSISSPPQTCGLWDSDDY